MTDPIARTFGSVNDRQLMALYYGYGRKDASIGEPVAPDPLRFSEFYRSQAEEFFHGTSSYLPSVQEAWDVYRRSRR
jgi:hypothetical protein